MGPYFLQHLIWSLGAKDTSFVGCGAGPCPNCGGNGSILDGIYNSIGNAIQILSDSSRTRTQLQRLAAVMHDAHQSKPTARELGRRLDQDLPELSSLRDVLPKTRNEL